MIGIIASAMSSTAFVPTDIAGCVLWLDADNSASITHSANAVSQWNDRSASGFNVSQGTAGARPTTNTVTIGGKNAISFDGGDFLNYAGTTSLNVGATTLFVVGGATDAATHAGFVAFHDTSGTDFASPNALLLESSDSGHFFANVRDLNNPDGLGQVSGSGATPTDIWAGRFASGGLTEAFRGSTGAGSSTTRAGSYGVAAGGVLIGGRYNGGITGIERLNGPIAEIVVYNSTLSNANLNSVGSHLATKWGQTWTTI